MSNKVRFGVLGISNIAARSAIPAIVDSEYAELAALGSRSMDKAKEFASKYACEGGSYEQVLESDIDAVYISLPNSMHAEWSIKAAQAGKHIWCDKPAALSYDSAQKMVASAKENKVRLMEGFMFLHHPQHAKVREIIDSGAIGEITRVEARYAAPRPARGNIRLDPMLGGGVYNDMYVYPVRASRFLFDAEPQGISCEITLEKESGVDGKAEAILEYTGGRKAEVSGEFTSDYRNTYKVLGTKGSVSLERAYAVQKGVAVSIYVETAGCENEVHFESVDQFRLMIDDFCQELNSGHVTRNYEEDLLMQAKVLDAGRASFREHRVVKLSEL